MRQWYPNDFKEVLGIIGNLFPDADCLNDLLTYDDVAKKLDTSAIIVESLVKSGKLKATKIGKHTSRIKEIDYFDYVNNNYVVWYKCFHPI